MLEALSFGAANIRDSGLVLLNNCNTPHDGFPVDPGSAATMNNVTASGVFFHTCTMPHDRFHVALLHNCTTSYDSFTVYLESAATMNNNVTASSVLFHNCTKPHDRFRIDPNMSANNVMGTGTQMEWSAFLN